MAVSDVFLLEFTSFLSVILEVNRRQIVYTRQKPNKMKPMFFIFANIQVNIINRLHPLSFKTSILHSTMPSKRVKINCIVIYFKIVIFGFFLNTTVALAQEWTHGTTIVLVRTKDSIVVGADSKVSYDYAGISLLKSTTTEKIRAVGNTCYAVSGVYSYSPTGFDIFKIVDSSLALNSNIYQQAEMLCINIRKPIEDAWKNMLTTTLFPNLFARRVAVGIFGFYEDIPTVILYDFRPKNIPSALDHSPYFVPELVVVKSVYPSINAVDSTYSDWISDVSDQLTLGILKNLGVVNPVAFIQVGLQKAIEIDPTGNGAPIRIMSITREGYHWIQ